MPGKDAAAVMTAISNGSPMVSVAVDWSANQSPTSRHASSQVISSARPPNSPMLPMMEAPGAGLPPSLGHDADADAEEGEGEHGSARGEDLQHGVVDVEQSRRPEAQARHPSPLSHPRG